MEKRQFLFTLLGVLLTMLLPTGCDRQQQFDLVEREFRRVTDLQSELLGDVLSAALGDARTRCRGVVPPVKKTF